jgi:ABC-type phosphate/phosphonate transport system substrate-binding protein
VNRTPVFLTIFLLAGIFLLANCTFPSGNIPQPTETPSPAPSPAVTPTDTVPAPFSPAKLGLAENPLILALPPGANSAEQIAAAKTIAAQFTQRTGYTVVTIVPESYTELVDDLEKGNAHIVLLEPYAYELAYEQGSVKAAYGVMKDGKSLYGSQFLATRKGGFQSYYEDVLDQNTEPASVALAQLAGKKPCWSDESSASGYVIPLGYLNDNQIITKPAAFVQGHPTVVRSLYATGICDFGATYVDAREFPSLMDEFPDLKEQVIVVWRIPEIIPYDILAFSSSMPEDMRNLFSTQVAAILQTDEGRAAFKTAYGIEELQVVNDGFYAEFRKYLQASGIDLTTLVK